VKINKKEIYKWVENDRLQETDNMAKTSRIWDYDFILKVLFVFRFFGLFFVCLFCKRVAPI
jgi:hypothetical protein